MLMLGCRFSPAENWIVASGVVLPVSGFNVVAE